MVSSSKKTSKKTGPSQRQLRVGEEVRHILSHLLSQRTIASPVLDKHSVTISEVRISPDLRHAMAYVMPLGGAKLGDAETDVVIKELNSLKGLFNQAIAKSLTTKMTPRVMFRVDDTFDEADLINRLLNDPRVRRDIENVSEE